MNIPKSNLKIVTLAFAAFAAPVMFSAPAETQQLFFEQEQRRIPEVSRKKEALTTNSKSSFFKEVLIQAPYRKMLMTLVAGGAIALGKMTRTAWQENSDKEGMDKVKGIISTLKDNGLDSLLDKVRESTTVNYALSALATELVMSSAKKGLAILAHAV